MWHISDIKLSLSFRNRQLLVGLAALFSLRLLSFFPEQEDRFLKLIVDHIPDLVHHDSPTNYNNKNVSKLVLQQHIQGQQRNHLLSGEIEATYSLNAITDSSLVIASNHQDISPATSFADKLPGRWVPVPLKERHAYDASCNNPFQHCCIGQGHATMYQRKNVEPLYVKWSTEPPLSGLIDVINYLSEQKKKNAKSYYSDRNTSVRNNDKTTNSNTKTTRLLDDLNNDINDISNDQCNIWMIGDSLTGDHTVAAMCDLTARYGYELINCAGLIGPDYSWTENHFCYDYINKNTTNSISGLVESKFPHFLLKRTNIADSASDSSDPSNDSMLASLLKNSGCSHVLIKFTSTHFNTYKTSPKDYYNISSKFIKQGGVIMWNHGTHCKKPQCVNNFINTHVEPFLTWFQPNMTQKYENSDKIINKWYFVWRETEPQHFNTLGGIHQYGSEKENCLDTTVLEDNTTAKSWMISDHRNGEAKDALKELEDKLQIHIPIIPIFDALVPRSDFHIDFPGDCTHYIYTPWRFDLTWDGMLKGMKDIDRRTISQ